MRHALVMTRAGPACADEEHLLELAADIIAACSGPMATANKVRVPSIARFLIIRGVSPLAPLPAAGRLATANKVGSICGSFASPSLSRTSLAACFARFGTLRAPHTAEHSRSQILPFPRCRRCSLQVRTFRYEGVPVVLREGALGDGVGARIWTVAHTLCR